MSPPGSRRLIGVLFLISVAGEAASASADVPMPGTQPEEFQDPINDFASFSASTMCVICHGGDFQPLPSEPYDGWAGSMMGNAAIDPLFLAALSVSEQDLSGVGDLCLRCHAPEAWLEGRAAAADGSELEPSDGGVTCHFCHRLVPDDPLGVDDAGPYAGNARFFLAKESRMHGPYDDVTLSRHETIQEPYVADPAYCGLCHEVSNPLVPWRDEDGHELGPEFPLQRTYSEWLRSAFPADGETCQTCHMAEVSGYACIVAGAPLRTIYMHQFAGANAWVPQDLRYIWHDDLHRQNLWADAVTGAREMLATAAELTFESLPDAVAPGATLALSVRVTNLTGHKLPTGYPLGRRMWLEVVVTDGAGERILESGAYDDATATRLEDPQLRAYEVQLGVGGEGGPSLHLARSDVILSDTRIPPRGYAPLSDDAGLEPVGRDYVDGVGGIAHWDVAPYEVPVACGAGGPLRVRVRLLQQTTSREYVEFLRDSQTSPLGRDRGATLYDAWEHSGRSAPVVMAEVEATVALDGACGDEGDAGAPDGRVRGGGAGCCAVAPGVHCPWEDAVSIVLLVGTAAQIALRRRR